MTNDLWGLFYSYAYATGLLLLSELLVRKFGWKQFVTRKLVHIGAGMWVWGILYFFDHWYWGVVPFATFIVLNFIMYKFKILQGVDDEDSSPGTVYFAISITILFLLFWRTGGGWDLAPIAVAGVMAMAWGDGLASLAGKRWGRHFYMFFNHRRSYEGSAAMFLGTFISVFLTLMYLPASALSPLSTTLAPQTAILFALFSAVIGSVAEALSPAGTDNLSVPLLVGALLWILLV
jgi:dolichol kinase